VVPTTSHPPRRSSGRDGNTSQSSPLKSVRLKVTVIDAGGEELARLAADKGLAVEAKGGRVSLVIVAATPEEALAQLGLFSAILASRT
jgi:hypothetical protein